jgi:predicted enzyme related to lactoylglutathione lyase
MNERNDHPPTTAEEHSVDARLARAGAITYLHIPAADVRQAAAFYRDVFGWIVSDLDSDRPSFDDAGGQLSGAWISDHLATSEPGLLPYIYVDHVEATVTRILAHGGEIVSGPRPEGRLTVATFRDPAGNTVGLWHDTTRTSPVLPHHRAATDPDADPRQPSEAVMTSIQPELWVERTSAAAAFYQAAFGATIVHQVGDKDDIVAQLSVGEAAFWVAPPSPSMKRLNPQAIDGRTSRTLLVVADPEHVVKQAVGAGATETSPVANEHGWRLGRIVDPFGHEWEIGTPLGTWLPT